MYNNANLRVKGTILLLLYALLIQRIRKFETVICYFFQMYARVSLIYLPFYLDMSQCIRKSKKKQCISSYEVVTLDNGHI